MSNTGTIPSGWDATTYNNFKAANPNLEPNAQDTAVMQGAGSDALLQKASALGTDASKQTGVAFSPYVAPTVPTTLNSGSLAPSSPISLPPTPVKTPSLTPTVIQPTGTTIDANGNASVTPPAATDITQPSKQQGIMDKIASFGDILAGKAQVTQNLQTENKLADKTLQATTDYNAYTKAKTDLQHQIDAIYTQPGVGTDQMNSAAQELSRRGNANLANLAIVAQASQGLLSAAQQTIKDKLEAQFQPIQDQIDFYTKFAQLNANDLTESEKFKLQQNADQKKSDLKLLTDTADTLHQALLQNNAPASTYSAIDKINNDYVSGKITASEAQSKMYQAAGKYGVDQSKALDAKYKNAQIAKLYSDINASNTGNGVALPQDYSGFLSSRTPAQAATFNSLPANDQSVVAQLVNGDALLSDIVKSRGAAGTKDIQKYIQEATAIDPTFSVNVNKVRYNFLQDWNNPNGKASITRNAINTALGHLADFKTNADALDPGTVRKLNNVKNILTTETGDPKVLQLRTDINALASEIATIYKGGQPTDSEIKNWESTIAADFSKQQFSGVSNEISKLLSSKISSTRYQYKSTMGFDYDQSLIDPDKRQALIDAGIDPNVIAKESVPVAPITPATTISQTKSGKSFDVAAAKLQGYTQDEIQQYLNTH